MQRTHTGTIIEVSKKLNTASGLADLYNVWSESAGVLASFWTDSDKPSPFLRGKQVNDLVRFVEVVKTDIDLNGKTVEKVKYSVIPPAPEA